MSESRGVAVGFWIGIGTLICGAALGGICIANHWWLQTAINFLVTVPFSVWGLQNNRESYMLQGKIAEMKRWSLL